MPMTNGARDLYEATHLLALAASNDHMPLLDICVAVGMEPRPGVLKLARRMMAASVGAGNWRESRAEAEAKLRTKWGRR